MERYRVGPGMLLRHWEGEDAAVVRAEHAGQTHLISRAAFFVLEALSNRPAGMSPQEVAAELLGSDAEEATGSGTGWIESTLNALSQAGLLAQFETDDDAG